MSLPADDDLAGYDVRPDPLFPRWLAQAWRASDQGQPDVLVDTALASFEPAAGIGLLGLILPMRTDGSRRAPICFVRELPRLSGHSALYGPSSCKAEDEQ